MLNEIPILSTIIWLPVLAGCLMFLYPQRYLPVITSLISVALCGFMLFNFDKSIWNMQFVEQYDWIPILKVYYGLGVDGFAVLLVSLTALMTLVVNIAAFTHVKKEDFNAYCATFLIMQGLMCGVFMALDAILFYVFFEAMMIPMFLIIGLWGGPNRVYATIKFILYTFFGSLFLLSALLYLNWVSKDFSINTFHNLDLSLVEQKWLFWAFLLSFAVKIPMWPVHTWLPDAHTEAPTGGSVILAAITLKMGGYGMLRFMLPIVPDGCAYFSTIVIFISLIAIAYVGLVAIIQKDMKKLIAYSSIAHMGFVTLGLFVGFQVLGDTTHIAMGIEGAVMQMISHGLVSGALFLCVGVLYVRMHTRLINDYGGVANTMPLFASFFMLFSLANVGLPGTSGFVGEFLIILSSYKANFWYAFISATTLILGVSYTLWMYKRVVFGEVVNDAVAALKEISINEKIMFSILAFAVLLLGLWPDLLLNYLHGSTDHLISQIIRG